MSDDNSLIMACCADIAGQIRGKGFPAADLEERLVRGIGWTPTNVQITCFDVIAETPFGALGDLVLIPDPATRFRAVGADGALVEDAMLGDIKELDGTPWSCCTRSILKAALARLEGLGGLRTVAAFEHEFRIEPGGDTGSAYSLAGARAGRRIGERLFALMAENGLGPDTFMKEYGPDQYEITMEPADGLAAADRAVIVRELARIAARENGQRATFTPIRDPASVGNGVHIHISLVDGNDTPVMYDGADPNGLSRLGGAFAAGITTYLPAFLALLAPSAASYFRLTPHRWSAAYNNLGLRDREAAVRICPTTALNPRDIARPFNLGVRAADAAAAPHLQLAAILFAGAEGIARELAAPHVTEADLSEWDEAAVTALGYRRLPTSLEQALDTFAADETVTGWFDRTFVDIYLAHKRGELAVLDGLDAEAICARYAGAY